MRNARRHPPVRKRHDPNKFKLLSLGPKAAAFLGRFLSTLHLPKLAVDRPPGRWQFWFFEGESAPGVIRGPMISPAAGCAAKARFAASAMLTTIPIAQCDDWHTLFDHKKAEAEN